MQNPRSEGIFLYNGRKIMGIENENGEFEPNQAENSASEQESTDMEGNSDIQIPGPSEANDGAFDEDVDPVAVTRDFRNIRLYLQIAGICGPLSLLFGGILLGTVALIFAILALRKIMRYTKRQDELGWRALYVRKFAILALVICAGCLVANIVFVVTYMPQLTEMFTSGATGMPSSGVAPGGGTTSTWG